MGDPQNHRSIGFNTKSCSYDMDDWGYRHGTKPQNDNFILSLPLKIG